MNQQNPQQQRSVQVDSDSVHKRRVLSASLHCPACLVRVLSQRRRLLHSAKQQTSQATFGQPSFRPSTKTLAFGQTSAFGKTAFGQTATPAFGQSSMPTTSAFCGGNNTGSSGFGSFTSQGPVKFGTTGFSFGVANSTTSSPASMTMVQQASSIM